MDYFERFQHALFSLPRIQKKALMLLTDAIVLPWILLAAYATRMGFINPVEAFGNLPSSLFVVAPLVTLGVLTIFGAYRSMVRYQGIYSAAVSAIAMLVASVGLAGVSYLAYQGGIPRSVFLIYWALGSIYLAGSRLAVRTYIFWWLTREQKRTPVVIFGAGSSGYQLSASLNGSVEYAPVAFVDDSRRLQGTVIQGLPVLSREQLRGFVGKQAVKAALLAIPRATKAERLDVVNFLKSLPNLEVKSVPSFVDIVSGKARIEEVRSIAIEELLGRDPVPPKADLISACISGKNVLVTGAGGSIGSELCRQIVALAPQRSTIPEQSEISLYQIEKELRQICQDNSFNVELVQVLGSVLNQRLIQSLCEQHQVHTFYHAAAYKHVPIVEANSTAGVRNNIMGTYHAAKAAEAANVERFILISTDKAVRPTNVMGATKRFAELVLQAMADRGSDTVFTMVRFGNVLGSSGSVVPLFNEQIKKGGPVTVTHPEVTRYFMTIPEAALLVIQAGAMAKGGEVFLLDMGEPVKIYDLACTMVSLMGATVRNKDNPDGDIEIKFTGLRPGEKLYEELLICDAGIGTEHSMIMQARENFLPWEQFVAAFHAMQEALDLSDDSLIRTLLLRYVEGYQPASHDGASTPETALQSASYPTEFSPPAKRIR